jgi:hypothetical protein
MPGRNVRSTLRERKPMLLKSRLMIALMVALMLAPALHAMSFELSNVKRFST